MYRRLAAAAGGLSRVLLHVSSELQQLADAEKSLPSSAPPPLTNASSDGKVSGEGASDNSSSFDAAQHVAADKQLHSRADVKAVCDWLKSTGLYAWLPFSEDQHRTRKLTHTWLSSMWSPPASETAYHSLTYSVGSSSALLSGIEKVMTNAAAHQLRLPSRFYWPGAALSDPKRPAPRDIGDPPSSPQLFPVRSPHSTNAAASATTTMLWPTAMRTTTGDTVQRPASASTPFFSALTRTVALPTLPSIATAGQVFAPAPRTPTASAEPSSGGGVLFSSRFEAYMTLLLTARTQALTRSASQHNVFAGQEAAAHQLGRLVLYAGDQVDPLLLRAAQLAGIQHLRLLQTVAGDRQLPPSPPPLPPSSRVGTTDDIEVVHHYNYTVDVTRLQARLMEDVAAGLYPMMVVGTFGSGLSGAVDPLAALGAFCTKLGVWYHIDASHGGPALLASGRRADPSPPSPISASGQSRWRAFAAEFEDAACIADSLLLPAGGSALPYSTVPGSSIHLNGGRGLAGAALLFVAHVRKVAWAVQSLGESRQSTFNQHVTPGVSDSDVLRLGSLAHSCGWFAELAAAATATAMHGGGRTRKEAFHHTAAEEGSSQTSVVDNAEDALVQTTRCGAPSPLPPTDPRVHLADLVAWHQQFTSAVLHAIRSDGRFDASLDAALFGMVRLRWLTAADEATRELARAWADVLNADVRAAALKNPSEASANAAASSTARRDDSLACETSGTPPLQVYVGVVQLQRRLWVSLSFGVLPHSRAKAKEEVGYSTLGGSAGSGSREGCSCTASTKEAEEYVLHTLDLAARRVQSKGTT